jgi:hypothetical protein
MPPPSHDAHDAERPDWPFPVQGGKYLRRLEALVRALRPADAHGNRALHLDDVLTCYLPCFFNPAIRSLRTVEDFSQTRQARRFLTVERIPRSTLSDFQRAADPALLGPIVRVLRDEALRRDRGRADLPEDLRGVLGRVLAVDGPFFDVAADVLRAFRRRGGRSPKAGRPRRQARLDVHLDVETWVPEVVSVADGEGEAEHALRAIVPGAIHVYDRGIFSFDLVAAHAPAGAHFVHRLRQPGPRTPRFAADEDRPLTERDREAGVVSDGLGHLVGSQKREAPAARYREVVAAAPGQSGGVVRPLTDLLDLPAWVIGLIYRYRWQVGLFFRWLKTCARFREIWGEGRAGVQLQFAPGPRGRGSGREGAPSREIPDTIASRAQCSPSSIPQWPRTRPASSAPVAARLVR